MSVLLHADGDQVLAFRLASHNLSKRLPPGSLLEAAAACGLQNTPPGSAALALNARVSKLTPAEIDRAIEVDMSLIQTSSLLTSPHIFPTQDLRVFTTGLLPNGEESLRFFILGPNQALDLAGIGATEIVERTATELLEVLDGRILTFRQLSAELTERVARRLSREQLVYWRSPSWYGPNQCLERQSFTSPSTPSRWRGCSALPRERATRHPSSAPTNGWANFQRRSSRIGRGLNWLAAICVAMALPPLATSRDGRASALPLHAIHGV